MYHVIYLILKTQYSGVKHGNVSSMVNVASPVRVYSVVPGCDSGAAWREQQPALPSAGPGRLSAAWARGAAGAEHTVAAADCLQETEAHSETTRREKLWKPFTARSPPSGAHNVRHPNAHALMLLIRKQLSNSSHIEWIVCLAIKLILGQCYRISVLTPRHKDSSSSGVLWRFGKPTK